MFMWTLESDHLVFPFAVKPVVIIPGWRKKYIQQQEFIMVSPHPDVQQMTSQRTNSVFSYSLTSEGGTTRDEFGASCPLLDLEELHHHCPRKVTFFPLVPSSVSPLMSWAAEQSTLISHGFPCHQPITPSPGVGECTVKWAEPLISKSSKHDGYKPKHLSPTGKTSERNHLLSNRMNKVAI